MPSVKEGMVWYGSGWVLADRHDVRPCAASSLHRGTISVSNISMVWYGMVEVCEGAPVAVSGWVLTDRHDVRPCMVKGHGTELN